ncbi:SDR family NAD(P)-dependent oxidoreductase [Sphingobium indicum]|uniref:3-hydroxyacyl-CoA dehydrogenase n=3 Tax=Sphingobium indicum TaxID=332055 RepID=A0A8E0WT99_9SPHN|nr:MULTISPECIES: SDR family NAD(P)-dependent oxidoreductase [Sphingobium]EPR11780.1 3-hydroxyacyl-CoA dehydrogenase [Sphingobium indicum IP26]KEZ00370.1 3-hydroxyacyl-CoA dehydrogenase [Sphingomonas sp. BHC-A]APL95721.1 3-hydroxyacyl-CoA dehydrogenase [Sphingobium indicum B90A]EQB01565.1 3-hydroxyacyl-CoA dehydrogenase [Sphingobium sp. HDIP04]KER36989.1 3-hydroxyacyl-CoA dehydrogenase [Sphingobium indicum F2]
MAIDLRGRVAIVTGAGGGLGREHALLLAKRGARVLVNDLGGASDGRSAAAEAVAEEIRRNGGEAISNGADVTDVDQVAAMVEQAKAAWGRIDILVNNAGILRDRTFAKQSLDDFRLVIEVHLMGSVNCTKAVWGEMIEQGYGRIVMTTSSSGLYGNFGQSQYGAAKMGLVGLMKTLSLEGRRNDVRVNCLAPTAATGMTEGILEEQALAALDPALVAPGMLALVCDDAPNGMILCAGAGSFECAHITLTQGLYVGADAHAPERILAGIDRIRERAGEMVPVAGMEQSNHELSRVPALQSAAADG